MDVNPDSEVSIFESLARPFPGFAVRWRIGRKSKKGDKAMPLAYIDARDVMDRLDGVVGPQNWQTKYTETASGRVICELSILVNGEWITKSDGAGDTQVEREKGAISDAFKRAAVHWAIGRYLYSMDAPWHERIDRQAEQDSRCCGRNEAAHKDRGGCMGSKLWGSLGVRCGRRGQAVGYGRVQAGGRGCVLRFP